MEDLVLTRREHRAHILALQRMVIYILGNETQSLIIFVSLFT